MRVLKRNGTYQDVHFDKITTRISHLARGLAVESVLVAQKVCGQLVDGIKTSELDEISAQNCMSMYAIHPDYNVLGSRLLIDNHKKNTPSSMLDVVNQLTHILHPEYVECVCKNFEKYDSMIDFDRDFLIDYFGMKTLQRSYLLKSENKTDIERPQHLWMRLAIALHKDNFDLVQETYDYISTKHFTHASPTLFNAGTKRPQMSSCFIPGTLVDTVNRGPVPIENVNIGDLVVTHKNNIKPVLQKHVNPIYDRKLYNVYLYNTRTFTVTENHKLWVYNSTDLTSKWKRVDELVNTDYVKVPYHNFVNDIFSYKPLFDKYIYTDKRIIGYENWKSYEGLLPNHVFKDINVIMTDEHMWLLGILSSCSIVKYTYKKSDTKCITGINVYINDKSLQDKIIQLLTDVFNITKNDIVLSDRIIVIDNIFIGIIMETILNTIPIEFMLFKKSLVKSWLNGFCQGSEYISKSDNDMIINVTKFSTSYLDMICTWLKLHGFNISHSYKYTSTNSVQIFMQIDLYYNQMIEFKHVPCFSNLLRNINGELFVKVTHVNLSNDKHEYVYTLGVEDDHSYSINGIVAENCFLTTVDDSVEGIFKTLSDCAQISKWAGGIGINISDIRGTNSIIRGTNGHTSGIMPLLKTYNATGRYINQCFIGSTIIYTNNGPKPIKNIIKNVDCVLTKDGTYKLVEDVFTNDINKTIMKIRNSYTFEAIKCTKEHQIYVTSDKGNSFEYKNASDLNLNDYMVYPIPTESIDNDNITFDICRLYGILLSHSYIMYEKNGLHYYILNIPTKNTSTIEFINSQFSNITYEEITPINTMSSNIHTCKSYKFILNDLKHIQHEWIYSFKKTKAIHSNFLNLPLDKLLYVLYGILETKINLHNKTSHIYFISSNRMLIETMRQAFLKFKTLTFGNKVYDCNAYCIKIPLNHNLNDLCKLFNRTYIGNEQIYKYNWIEKDNHLLCKIKSIDTIAYKGTVFDLQVSENHNYTTHMGLVHNSGKRLGSFAMYIEPWHVDIFDFLNAKKNQGAEEERARDLFYGLWIPDLFMKRVKENATWSLMCPDTCKGLTNIYGEEFEKLYIQYETEEKYVRQVNARQVWDSIIESQIESGTPYMLYKDSVNRKNPQENIGVIKQSNLCTEIVLYTDQEHISVCNLASIALPQYINQDDTSKFDFEKLEKVVRIVTRNLNKVIDYNFYPIPEARHTNLSHRPIGIGIQGLADLFAIMKIPFDSQEARNLNKCIFECIYYASLSESCELSKIEGPYENFNGSPMSRGILQFDMWDPNHVHPSDRYNWNKLKQDIQIHGLRNSTLLAPMPTASTSQILGFNECLTGDTLVTNIQGIATPLHCINVDDKLVSYNEQFNNLTTGHVSEFLDKGEQNIIRLYLCDGRYIDCTPNHKFRVFDNKTLKYEWLEAEQINRDYSFVMGMQGITDLYCKDEFKTQLFNSYIEDVQLNQEQCLAICRLLGFLTGDGNYMDDNKICLNVDTLYDVYLIISDVNLIYKSDDINSYCIKDNTLNFTITLYDPVTNIIRRFIDSTTNIPSIFLHPECPLSAVREYIAGYCGVDGIAPFLLYDENKTSPIISGCNVLRAFEVDVDVSITDNFMNHLVSLFRKLNIAVNLNEKEYIYDDEDLTTVKMYNLTVHDIESFNKYVGYRYNIHKMMRSDFVRLYNNYKNNVISQYQTILENAINIYYSTDDKIPINILSNAINSFDGILLDETTIPSLEVFNKCIETKSIQDVIVDINPEKLLEQFGLIDLFSNSEIMVNKTKLCVPVYHIPYSYTKNIDGPVKVYDINIPNTHSFVANGIVTHNCIEPFTSNLYARRTLAGEFVCINKYLIRDLIDIGLWSKDLMEKLIYYKGSVQYIKEIPQNIKDIYKTAWEIKQKSLIEMAADRAVYICQSQSLNLFFENPSYKKLTSAHFLGWQLGLKTGSYYIRSQSAIDAQNVTIDPNKEKEYEKLKQEQINVMCPLRKKGAGEFEPCESCSG